MNIRKTIFLLILISTGYSLRSYSQELNCRIQVSHQAIQGVTIKQTADKMRQSIYEFINNRKWTEHVYSFQERIECNIFINLTNQISSDEFSGTLQIQATRPIYGSSYNTLMFNYIDHQFRIKYIEDQPMEFSETSHLSNLTSILAYYVYIILGLDYDSFSPQGGNPYFEKAQMIVNNAQSAPQKGWKSHETTNKDNRYWLVETLLNSKYKGIRECIYKYHRLGLDVMHDNREDGRKVITEALFLLDQVYRADPNIYILQVFFDAKSDEIIKIFSEAFPDEKRRVYELVKRIDPGNIKDYEEIMKSKE